MIKRILTGAVLVLALGLILGFSHIPFVLNSVAAFFSVIATIELFKAAKLAERKGITLTMCLLAVLLSFIKIPATNYIIAISFILMMVIFTLLMVKLKTIKKIPAMLSVLIALIITISFRCMVEIRTMEKGIWLLITGILVPMLTDIFAHLIGSAFGKHKLAPIISPNKTIEGSIGGTLVSVMLMLLLVFIAERHGAFTVSYSSFVPFLILSSLLGQFGDLCFSVIKRIYSVKDYGKLLPGHGGILDRFDSTLFVLPFMYVYCLLGLTPIM